MRKDNFYEELSEEMDKRTTMISALKKIVKAFDTVPNEDTTAEAADETICEEEILEKQPI